MSSRGDARVVKRPAQGVYVGRGSPYGNPFVIGRDGTRDQVIAKYRTYFYERLAADPRFASQVENLRGFDLVCFCAPLPCHGDVILEYLLAQEGET